MIHHSRRLLLVGAEELRMMSGKFFMADRCGFFICLDGTGEISYFNSRYSLRRGTVALFHPFVRIAFHNCSASIRGYWGENSLGNALPVVNKVLAVDDIEAIKADPVAQIPAPEFDRLLKKIDNHLEESRELECETAACGSLRPICAALSASRNETLMLEILHRFFLTKSRHGTAASGMDLVFQRFIIDVQTNYTLRRDTAFYASRSGLSPKYFSSVIKKVSGAAPFEWIVQTVVSAAGSRLLDSSMTVKEISASLGFPSQAVFCKYFKRYTGFSPQKFRSGR